MITLLEFSPVACHALRLAAAGLGRSPLLARLGAAESAERLVGGAVPPAAQRRGVKRAGDVKWEAEQKQWKGWVGSKDRCFAGKSGKTKRENSEVPQCAWRVASRSPAQWQARWTHVVRPLFQVDPSLLPGVCHLGTQRWHLRSHLVPLWSFDCSQR